MVTIPSTPPHTETLMQHLHRGLLFALVTSIALTASTADAYTYETLQTRGCHEEITVRSLLAARQELPTAGPLQASDVDQVAIDDLPFDVDTTFYRDIGAVTLLVGVRDNDLKGKSGLSAQELVKVHGAVDNQREHCLRRPGHDEPDGSLPALEDCRAFILERFVDALEGLDESGHVNANDRVPLDVNLAFRGTVELDLPRTYVRLGQALHALQDSFTHTMRTADGHRVTVVLNWIDVVEGGHHEPRDGPPHMSALDECGADDDLRRERVVLAEESSLALLRAALDPTLTDEEKRGQAEAVMDDYLTYEPGCSAADDWCDAPENAFRDGSCLCNHPGGRPTDSRPASAVVILVAALALLRRPRRRVGSRSLAAASALVVVAAAAPVAAHDPAAWDETKREGFGVHTAVGGGLDNGALVTVLGARYGITNNWVVGLDVEYNPWFSFDARRFSRGVASSYAVGMYRFPVSDRLALRTIGRVGASVMLFDLVGVPAGSVGPFLGLTPLGLSYEIRHSVYFVIDPLQIAIPIPQVVGAPFAYRQYRLTLGFQLGA